MQKYMFTDVEEQQELDEKEVLYLFLALMITKHSGAFARF